MNRIKELRKEKKLTQMQLAEQLGINQTAISKWEADKTVPETGTLITLSEFFNVSIDYLLGRSDFYFPDNLNIENLFSNEELQLIKDYRELNSECKRLVINTIKAFKSNN